MLEYTILRSRIDHRNLVVIVNEYIANGWGPIGGICAIVVNDDIHQKLFYQSMTRETQNASDMVRRLRAAQKDEGGGTAQWYREELARELRSDDGEKN